MKRTVAMVTKSDITDTFKIDLVTDVHPTIVFKSCRHTWHALCRVFTSAFGSKFSHKILITFFITSHGYNAGNITNHDAIGNLLIFVFTLSLLLCNSSKYLVVNSLVLGFKREQKFQIILLKNFISTKNNLQRIYLKFKLRQNCKYIPRWQCVLNTC